MTIQNTQVPTPQPSVETMVGNKEQEYPKPSVPPEIDATDEEKSQQVTEESETDRIATANDTRETEVKAEVTKNKVNEYINGLATQDENKEIIDIQDTLKEYQELKEAQDEQKGINTYQQNMLR